MRNIRIIRIPGFCLLFPLFGISCSDLQPLQQEPLPLFAAEIRRDCAPWDGSAFTLSVPYEAGRIIQVSIWQSPDLDHPTRFLFPDDSMRSGNAMQVLGSGEYQPLAGSVYFRHVDRQSPVEGRFDLLTETGQRLEGEFKAEWENEPVYCG